MGLMTQRVLHSNQVMANTWNMKYLPLSLKTFSLTLTNLLRSAGRNHVWFGSALPGRSMVHYRSLSETAVHPHYERWFIATTKSGAVDYLRSIQIVRVDLCCSLRGPDARICFTSPKQQQSKSYKQIGNHDRQ